MAKIGSSPRVWGQDIKYLKIMLYKGIIPTRVGTSPNNFPVSNSKKDHPHACGDKSVDINGNRPEIGSSPRVWGQVVFRKKQPLHRRIIPTRVGTSTALGFAVNHTQDHPHACGDKLRKDKKNDTELGSSPRVWGQATTV